MRSSKVSALICLTATTLALSYSLVACAPEPGNEAGAIDKDTQTVSPETSWGDQVEPEEDLVTTLPDSFPTASFLLPQGAEIFNAGTRSENQWFVVLHAADQAQADLIWASVISQNSFAVSDEVATTEGGQAANLTSQKLQVAAMTIPQSNGSVLLSYDLQGH